MHSQSGSGAAVIASLTCLLPLFIVSRCTAAHRYLHGLAGPFEFDFEDEKLSREDGKARVYAEILHYHPEGGGGASARIQLASPSFKEKASSANTASSIAA